MRATALGSIANLQNSLFVTACEFAARHKVVGFQARAAAFLTGCSGPGVRQHLRIAHVEHLSSAGFKAALLISRPDLGSFDAMEEKSLRTTALCRSVQDGRN
jgi:hypothetical protein